MGYTTEQYRKAKSYIRNTWEKAPRGVFRLLWQWGNHRQKLMRFRALQQWAAQRQRAARTDKGRAKWKRKRYEYREKVERLENPQTGCGAPGYPHWAGATSILEQEVEPVSARFGVPVTSSKRTATLGNPSSDHYVGNIYADARDLGTTNGRALAHAIADALGISGYSTGTYTHYYIRRCGRTFRVQILWAVSGHYDHVHVGIRLVS